MSTYGLPHTTNTVWAWCPTDLETSNDILKLVGDGYLVFASRGKAVSLLKLPYNCRRQISITGRNWASRLSASVLAFSETDVTRDVGGVGNLFTRLVIFHIDWFLGSRDSIVALHLSFSHTFSWGVTEYCRRLISTFRAGFMVLCLE